MGGAKDEPAYLEGRFTKQTVGCSLGPAPLSVSTNHGGGLRSVGGDDAQFPIDSSWPRLRRHRHGRKESRIFLDLFRNLF